MCLPQGEQRAARPGGAAGVEVAAGAVAHRPRPAGDRPASASRPPEPLLPPVQVRGPRPPARQAALVRLAGAGAEGPARPTGEERDGEGGQPLDGPVRDQQQQPEGRREHGPRGRADQLHEGDQEEGEVQLAR